MSSLIFLLQPESVCLATDTLCLAAATKVPFRYTTKFVMFPHLRAVMCCTGVENLFSEWVSLIQSKLVGKGISILDQVAQEELPRIWREMSVPTDWTSTIYQFGFSEEFQRFKGYAYRSTNHFRSESLIDGFGIKPDYGKAIQDMLIKLVEEQTLEEAFVETTKKLKEMDDALPPQERLGIGGEIHFAVLQRTDTHVRISYRFNDYDDIFNKMVEELNNAATLRLRK